MGGGFGVLEGFGGAWMGIWDAGRWRGLGVPSQEFGVLEAGEIWGAGFGVPAWSCAHPFTCAPPPPPPQIVLPPHLERIREKLAENIHELWALTRIEQGWTYGPVSPGDPPGDPPAPPEPLGCSGSPQDGQTPPPSPQAPLGCGGDPLSIPNLPGTLELPWCAMSPPRPPQSIWVAVGPPGMDRHPPTLSPPGAPGVWWDTLSPSTLLGPP